MIINVKAQNKTINKLFEPPIIGTFLIFIFAVLPVPLLFILNAIFEFTTDTEIEKVNALTAGIWNIFLTFGLKIKIEFFLIPAWILFTIIGLFRYIKLTNF